MQSATWLLLKQNETKWKSIFSLVATPVLTIFFPTPSPAQVSSSVW